MTGSEAFKALMALASKQTQESQLALAKENQLRQAREKAKRAEEERKERERNRLEKERLARQKLEDQKREQALAEERQKRQAERAAAAAELSKANAESNRSSDARTSRSTNTPRNRTYASRSVSSATAVPTQDAQAQRQLEREEKQARARAKMFGEPVSVHKKSSTTRSNPNSQRNGSTSLKSPLRPSTSAKPTKSNPKTNLSSSSLSITARQRITQQFSASERKPLNQTKRDRRTIEEIERDMKRRRVNDLQAANGQTRNEIFSSSHPSQKASVSHKRMASGSSPFKSLQSPRNSQTAHSENTLNPILTNPVKRPLLGKTPMKDGIAERRSQPSTNTNAPVNRKYVPVARRADSHDDDYEDEYETEDSEADVPVAPKIRDEIWKIMGKDRRQYANTKIMSDDESDDMEADVDDVLEEEERAARLARLEDQREQDALKRHELEKKRRLTQSRPLSK